MQNSSLFPRCLLLSASVLVGVSLGASAAHAGFEWVPPGTQVTETAAPVVTSQPAPAPLGQKAPSARPLDDMPYVITIEGQANAPKADHVLVPPPGAAPQALAAQPVADKPLKGFANDVPLTVALRQILPSDYGFSTAQDVDVGTLVSWRGGASWHQTLQDMLHVAGLDAEENGTMVRIVRAKSAVSGGKLAEKAAPAPVMTPGVQPHLQPMAAGGKPLPLGPSSMGVSLDQQYAAIQGGNAPAPTSVATHQPALVPMDMGSAPATDNGVTPTVDTWSAEKGDTLRKVLEIWSRKANVELVWQAEYDFPLQASVVLSGTFEEAVRNLLTGFQEAKPQPTGALHNGSAAGQSVLVISTRGNNYSG